MTTSPIKRYLCVSRFKFCNKKSFQKILVKHVMHYRNVYEHVSKTLWNRHGGNSLNKNSHYLHIILFLNFIHNDKPSRVSFLFLDIKNKIIYLILSSCKNYSCRPTHEIFYIKGCLWENLSTKLWIIYHEKIACETFFVYAYVYKQNLR